MFTLEDLDAQDIQATYEELVREGAHTTPEADVRLHPDDYFIVGN
jgi:hypothetical protein